MTLSLLGKLSITLIIASFSWSSVAYEGKANCETSQRIHTYNSPAIIKTQGELKRLESVGEPALHFLQGDARKEFYTSLRFNERGLITYNYQVLLDNLTEPEINQLMELFGFEQVGTQLLGHVSASGDGAIRPPGDDPTPPGWKGYYCSSPGTCIATDANMICTGNC